MLTRSEREMMEHALGRHYPNKPKDYRNYYAIDPCGFSIGVWLNLVEKGYAKRGAKVEWTDLVYFHVTEEGKKALDGL